MDATAIESDPQMLARLIKSGGRILVVGGGLADLPPKYREHPAIVLWDDDRQGMQVKEVPQNTKAILSSRWVSHATAAKLNEASRKLHALKFTMLRNREIKNLLSEVVAEEQQLPAIITAPTDAEIDARRHVQEEQEQQVEEKERMQHAAQPGKKGTILGFVAKNLALNTDWTQKGAMTREGDRIFAVAQKEGVATTIGSINECVRKVVRQLGKPTFGTKRAPMRAKTRVERPPKAVAVAMRAKDHDDFAELDRLMEEALAAIKLVQEHLPKVRNETERLRAMRQKMMDVLA